MAPDWPKWPMQLTYDLCTFFNTSPCPIILCIGCRAVPEDFMRLPGTVLTVISFLLEVHSLPGQIGFDQIIKLVCNTQRFMSYARTSGGNNLAVCRAKWAHIQYVQLVINFASAPPLYEIKNCKKKKKSKRVQIANTAENYFTKRSVDDLCMKDTSEIIYWGGQKYLKRALSESACFVKLDFFIVKLDIFIDKSILFTVWQVTFKYFC